MSNSEIKIVLEYQFIDNFNCLHNPADIYGDSPELDLKIANVKQKFLDYGWEGDGEINIIWIPPFLDQASNDTWGDYIWHVKQSNDGISFLGFNYEIQSARLLDQNPIFVNEYGEQTPISITRNHEEGFIYQLKEKIELLDEVKVHIDNSTISNKLISLNLGYIQNDIIAELNDFIDECYLEFLVHVLSENNPDGIKLRKMNVKISLDSISQNLSEGISDHWLTIHQIISNIWKDFKFLSFKDKFKEIMQCIDFTYSEKNIREINKHIVIRNCIQHHNGQLEQTSLKGLGLEKIYILGDEGKKIEIKKWKKILLTYTEVKSLIGILSDFCFCYSNHIKQRIKTRHFLNGQTIQPLEEILN